MMMGSTSRRRAANQDLPRQPSLISSSSTFLSPLNSDNPASGSISMEDLLDNIYPDPDPNSSNDSPPSDPVSDPPPLFHSSAGGNGGKVVEEASWKEADAGDGQQHPGYGFDHVSLTLEDYLMKSSPVEASTAAGSSVLVNGSLVQPRGQLGAAGGGGGGVGRGKRRVSVPEEPPVDKATQQKQRRMIKNRESAARSRERKQAYTAELESMVMQLEEENARLLREEVNLNKEKYRQLVKTVIPVTEGRRPQKTLRRMHSM
ncbi:hypothetical protein SAY86_020344 [Trapa natans]|uniref:BZIP domain-containing protein n=1 Tax=Trapa natans TaxID=22666 RepID=A0AAN7M1U4_TRANT|nr:hypothetical protein SAY86_020344 [Trapa natans]